MLSLSYAAQVKEMATEKEVSGGLGLEWRVTVPEGSSVKMEPEPSWISRTWNRLVELGSKLRSKVSTFGKKVWKIGADSPRKVIHGAKVGAALTLVSLFYYLRPLYNGFGSSAMWAVMTVVVVFEYTVGKYIDAHLFFSFLLIFFFHRKYKNLKSQIWHHNKSNYDMNDHLTSH